MNKSSWEWAGCKMKKWILMTIILLVLCINVAFSTKFHYPELPFSDKTKHEVINLATSSNVSLTKITQQDGYVWFITDETLDEALYSLETRMALNGWEFVEKNSTDYLFEKGNEKVVIKSQPWSRNYLLFRLPIGL